VPVAAVIANPSASRFTGSLHRDVCRLLATRYEVQALWPKSAQDARSLSSQAVADGADLIVPMGGDGVVHHVANAAAMSGTPIGVIPAGTTNVFARLLRLPRRPLAAAKVLVRDHRVLAQPLVEIRTDGSVDYGVFAVGFGLDAEVVEAAEQEPYRKYWFGAAHYAQTALNKFLGDIRRRPPHVRVTAGDLTADAVAGMVQFRPVYTYFGAVPLRLATPPPSPLTVLILNEVRLRRVLRIVRSAIGVGRMADISGLSVWPGVSELSAEADPAVALQADGEFLGRHHKVTLRHVADALHVVVPRHRKEAAEA